MSYLNHGVHLGLGVVLVQAGASLAGRGDSVSPPTAPRHGQLTVVGPLRDPLAARSDRVIQT